MICFAWVAASWQCLTVVMLSLFRWLLDGCVQLGPAKWQEDTHLSASLHRCYSKAVRSTLACCALDRDPQKLGERLEELAQMQIELARIGVTPMCEPLMPPMAPPPPAATAPEPPLPPPPVLPTSPAAPALPYSNVPMGPSEDTVMWADTLTQHPPDPHVAATVEGAPAPTAVGFSSFGRGGGALGTVAEEGVADVAVVGPTLVEGDEAAGLAGLMHGRTEGAGDGGNDVAMTEAEALPPSPSQQLLPLPAEAEASPPAPPQRRPLPPRAELLRCAYLLLQHSACLMEGEWPSLGSSLHSSLATCLSLAREVLPTVQQAPMSIRVDDAPLEEDGDDDGGLSWRRACLGHLVSAVRLGDEYEDGLLHPLYLLHAQRLEWLLELGHPATWEEQHAAAERPWQVIELVSENLFLPSNLDGKLRGSCPGRPGGLLWRQLMGDCMEAMRWCMDVYRPAGQYHVAVHQLSRALLVLGRVEEAGEQLAPLFAPPPKKQAKGEPTSKPFSMEELSDEAYDNAAAGKGGVAGVIKVSGKASGKNGKARRKKGGSCRAGDEAATAEHGAAGAEPAAPAGEGLAASGPLSEAAAAAIGGSWVVCLERSSLGLDLRAAHSTLLGAVMISEPLCCRYHLILSTATHIVPPDNNR